MECPICGAVAQDISRTGFDGESVRCPRHNDYDIAGGYRDKLEALDPSDRELVFQKALRFALPGTHPCISGSCF